MALGALTPVYVWSHRHLHDSFWLFSAARFALAFSLLFAPTVLMGATLPVLSRYMVRNTATLGWRVGTLYALNTGGAVVGCFAAGYVLLGRYGLSRTVWIGAALNLAIALVVWVGQRWAPEEARAAAPLPSAPDEGAGAPALYDPGSCAASSGASRWPGSPRSPTRSSGPARSPSSSATRRMPSAPC